MTNINGLVLNAMLGTPDTSRVSSMKIAVFIRDFLKIPLLTGKSKILKPKKVDFLFIINSSLSFTTQEFRDFIPAQIKKSKIVIYIQNDYLLVPRKFWREFNSRPFIFWSSIKRKVVNKDDKFMNFNVITYKPQKRIAPIKDVLFYYGSCRPNRIDDMRKYLNSKRYKVNISASSGVALKRYNILCPNADCYHDKSESIVDQIQKHKASIYMIDKTTARNLEMPANRFYECLSAGVPILFDSKAELMMKKAGYNVTPYIVNSDKDVKILMKSYKNIAQNQLKWRKDFINNLKVEIKKNLQHLKNKYLGEK